MAVLFEASQFAKTIEHYQGYKVACLEEVGSRNGWLTREEVLTAADLLGLTRYANYLRELVDDE
jgi:glucose-1-phosphate thymidylyltransferase